MEWRAVREHLRTTAEYIGSKTLKDGIYVDVYLLASERARWLVHLVEIGTGNSGTAVLTERYRNELQVESVLFVGVAGGVQGLRLGDVVVPDHVYPYQSGKQSPGGFGARPRSWAPPHRFLHAAKHAARELEQLDSTDYKIHFKPIASGDVVLNDAESDLRTQILHRHYEDAAAIEMEGAGFAQAAQLADSLQALIIRGISDLADGKKYAADAAGSQERAAANAAKVAIAALAALTLPEPGESTLGRGLTSQEPAEPPVQVPSAPPPAQGLNEPPRATEPRTEPVRASQPDEILGPPLPPPPERPATGPGASTPPPRRPRRGPRPSTESRQKLLKRALPAVALVAVAAVIAVVVLPGRGDGTDDKASSALSDCGEATDRLRIAASVDKSEPLKRAAEAYGNRSAEGQCVEVKVDGVNSGTGMRALARGWKESDGYEPDVWSPAGSTWLSLARARATESNKALFPQQAESIVQSPLTIAMPKPMAKALNWPERRFDWATLAEWAQNADSFWADHDKPEWGAFKLGKTNPGYSTSGLNATVAAFFAKTGTSSELGKPHIDKPANRAFAKSIEESAVHYGDTTLTFLFNLRQADRSSPEKAMSYISAVTLEENTVAAYNAGYPCGALSGEKGCEKTSKPDTPLVSFYPKDGVPFSDHPYIELTGMSPAQKAVSGDFLAYLHDTTVFDKQFAPYGFRNHKGDDPKGSKVLNAANGVLHDAQFTRMPMPGGEVLDHLLNVWPTLRRRANVRIVIDTSESMNETVPGRGETKIKLLKQAEPALFGEFTGTDRVGLLKFSDADVLGGGKDYKELVPLGPYNEKLPGGTRADLLSDNVKSLEPEGATGLYDTLDHTTQAMRDDYDPKAINAIVLLTDGRNEDIGSLSKETLLKRIGDPDQQQIRIFTIAYGNKADEKDNNGRSVLQEIADASGGRAYDARRAETIRDVLTSVISNF
ncbi:hypothetical protein GCM10010094_15700 [Streptomyces flaveus]|uniref:VWFA domain-containing protein n=1 Tax=Streptomyces flaveus TaxID=66370 RepID=A0A917VAK0_9ACTN|nr:hypothetical protein GCM10010094_15700 [Streptomyces flaveus]